MAVYKHTYRAYEGPLTSRWRRLLVLVRYGFTGIWSSRVTVILVIIGCIPTLAGMGAIYLANNPAARMLVGSLSQSNLVVDERFFFIPFQLQCWMALTLAAWITPRLVSPDLADNALPIILSHPITRPEYVLGKFLVLASTLSVITWVPGLLLFGFQVYSSSLPWAAQYSYIAFAILAGALVWITFLSVFAVALSAWVRWRIVATGAIFAAVFVPAGIGSMLNVVLHTRWGFLISIPDMMPTLWQRLFRVHSLWLDAHSLPVTAILFSLVLMICGCIAALNVRIRAREVVRG